MAGSDLFVGTLDLLILKAVSVGPSHGYAIGRWIRESTGERLSIKEGVLYPALHRLERRGLLEEEWGMTETNREARFYSLTVDGRRELRSQVREWQAHVSAVGAALGIALT